MIVVSTAVRRTRLLNSPSGNSESIIPLPIADTSAAAKALTEIVINSSRLFWALAPDVGAKKAANNNALRTPKPAIVVKVGGCDAASNVTAVKIFAGSLEDFLKVFPGVGK